MRPDVAGLGVNSEYRFEAGEDRVKWWTVALVQKIIVPTNNTLHFTNKQTAARSHPS